MARFTERVTLRDPQTFAPVSFAPGDEVPAWATVGEHVTDGGSAAPTPQPVRDAGETGGADAAYGEWTVSELREEIATRNEGRDGDDLLPSDGRKVDLVAVLTADDE